jgi:enolase-phosphatase E1
LPLLSGFYDTTFGKKQEVESYRKITTDIHIPANQILFLSDVAEEITAARQAGMQAIAVVRPSNKPLPAHFDGIKIESLNQLILA